MKGVQVWNGQGIRDCDVDVLHWRIDVMAGDRWRPNMLFSRTGQTITIDSHTGQRVLDVSSIYLSEEGYLRDVNDRLDFAKEFWVEGDWILERPICVLYPIHNWGKGKSYAIVRTTLFDLPLPDLPPPFSNVT